MNRARRSQIEGEGVDAPAPLARLVLRELLALAERKGDVTPPAEWIVLVTRFEPEGFGETPSHRGRRRMGRSKIALLERRFRKAMLQIPEVFKRASERLAESGDREAVFQELEKALRTEYAVWVRVVRGDAQLTAIIDAASEGRDNAWLCGDAANAPGLYCVTLYSADQKSA